MVQINYYLINFKMKKNFNYVSKYKKLKLLQ